MRFHGKIGFGESVENPEGSGIHVDTIVERSYFGDVVRQLRRLSDGEYLPKDVSSGNSLSIVADAYANRSYNRIQYAWFQGVQWVVTSVEVRAPRLILSLGEVYDGSKA